jgi:hypothetical protein
LIQKPTLYVFSRPRISIAAMLHEGTAEGNSLPVQNYKQDVAAGDS